MTLLVEKERERSMCEGEKEEERDAGVCERGGKRDGQRAGDRMRKRNKFSEGEGKESYAI